MNRPSLADRIARTCRYFNGTMNKVCRAGVNYRETVGGPDFGWGLRLPYLADRYGMSEAQQDEADKAVPCGHRLYQGRA